MRHTDELESFFLRKANLIKEQRAFLFGTDLLSNGWILAISQFQSPKLVSFILHYHHHHHSSLSWIIDKAISAISIHSHHIAGGAHTHSTTAYSQPASQPVLRTSIYLLFIYPNRVFSPRPPNPTFLLPLPSSPHISHLLPTAAFTLIPSYSIGVVRQCLSICKLRAVPSAVSLSLPPRSLTSLRCYPFHPSSCLRFHSPSTVT